VVTYNFQQECNDLRDNNNQLQLMPEQVVRGERLLSDSNRPSVHPSRGTGTISITRTAILKEILVGGNLYSVPVTMRWDKDPE